MYHKPARTQSIKPSATGDHDGHGGRRRPEREVEHDDDITKVEREDFKMILYRRWCIFLRLVLRLWHIDVRGYATPIPIHYH